MQIVFSTFIKLSGDCLFFTCTDVNECDSSLGLNGCSDSDTCVNSEGGYECSCSPGFKLENDKRTCTGNTISVL